MIGMGFVQEWDTLAGLRVILGLFEAGFFPGCELSLLIPEIMAKFCANISCVGVYLLSTWYVRCK